MTENCWKECPLICQMMARISALEKNFEQENTKKWRILWMLLYAVLTVAGIKVADALFKEYTIAENVRHQAIYIDIRHDNERHFA